ncbi:sporulation protein [Aquibacillus kalidii]|uniref:sporulation protein n=1 Tax=Aquibacillus kalidii TaxID=2762597 RepID=UPI001645EC54|nr:sporulation protein [Aquibacillus kalidii]
MDQNLAYLREVLSNYAEESEAVRDITSILEQKQYASERQFVDDLGQEHIQLLTQLLDKEMNHANESGDFERGYQLNGVYEQLY